jgi:hypothetical protein
MVGPNASSQKVKESAAGPAESDGLAKRRPAEAGVIQCGAWVAVPGAASPQGDIVPQDITPAVSPNAFVVSNVAVGPMNRYCFDVHSGGRRVVSFYFDTFDDALAAARAHKALMPQIARAQIRLAFEQRTLKRVEPRDGDDVLAI